MKRLIKILLFLCFILTAFEGSGQYVNRDGYTIWMGNMYIGHPRTGSITAPNSGVHLQLGDSATTKAFWLPRVQDTSAIASPRQGMQVYSISDSTVYYRDLQAWRSFSSSSPSSSGWNIGGNLFPVLPTPYPTIGTLAPWGGGFGIMTNSVVRAAVPDGGFTLSNDTTATKVFTWNPTTKDWGYANWNNGGTYTAGDGLLLTGTTFKVLTKRSITIDNDSLMLVNDSTATAPYHLYGFNIAGRRGFYRPDTNYISGFSTMVRPLISLTTTGSSGAATYSNVTGVLNIPQYSGGGSTKAYPNLFISNDSIYQRFNVLHYGADPTGATNSTTAFSACIAAIIAAGNGVMYIPNGYYLGKIVIPAVALPTLPTIKIEGESPPTPLFGTLGSYTLSNTAGAIIHDTSTSAGAVIQVAGSSINNVYLEIENLDVRSYDNPYISGVDAYWAYGLKITNSTINTGVYNVLTDTPSHSTIGVRTPAINNAGWTILRDVVVTGYYTGFEINEHTDGDNLVAASCERGMDFKTANLSSRFGRVNLMLCNYSLYVSGAHKFVIAEMNVEHQSGWYTTIRDIEDGSNLGVANLWYTTPNTFTVNGATGIKYKEIGTDYGLNVVTAIDNESDANISIGDPAAGPYALQLRRYDANRTTIPGIYSINVNTVSGDNSSEHSMIAGNGVVEGRIFTQYGTGSPGGAYSAGSGISIGTRTSHPTFFYTKNATRWWIDTLGHFLPYINNTYNIGSSSYYIKDLYSAGQIKSLGTGGSSSGINLEATSAGSYGNIGLVTDQGVIGRILVSGSTFTSGAFLPNEVTVEQELATGGVHLASIGAGGYIRFSTGGNASGNERWKMNSSGHFLASTDNTYDIGASGATRPRNIFIAGTGIFGGVVTSAVGTSTGNVATIDGTQTLTNKRWTARVGSTTSSATPTINTDNVDIYKLTAQAADITSMTTNLSGTPVDGDILEIQITGTAARAITWGASFVSTTVTLPATTVTTVTLTVILQYYTTSSYGNNKWHCVNYY